MRIGLVSVCWLMTSLFPGMVISSFFIDSRIGFFSSFGGITSSSALITGSSLTSFWIGSSLFSSIVSLGTSWISLSFLGSFLCVLFFSFFSSTSPVNNFCEISVFFDFLVFSFFSFFSTGVEDVVVSSGLVSVFCTSFFFSFFSSFFSFFSCVSSFLVSFGSLSGSGSILSSWKKSISFSTTRVLGFASLFLPLVPLLPYRVFWPLWFSS